MMERDRIDRSVNVTRGQQSRQCRRKAQTPGRLGVIERLDAEPVAREHDAAGLALPDRESEHAVEALDAARAPFRIGFEDDFGVALREEAISLLHELAAQLAIIINAAVENDREAEQRIDHRLLRCGRKIDDAETAVTERNALLRERAVRIGTARSHCPVHRRKRFACNGAVERHLAANSTHFSQSGTSRPFT